MNGFDGGVAGWFSSLAGHHGLADFLFLDLGAMDSFKLLPLVAGLVYLWSEGRTGQRDAIVGALGVGIAIVLTRLVQNFGPHRVRPLSSPFYDFPSVQVIADWSSFPSDTTAIACALALAIFLHSRRLGVVAFLLAGFDICAKLYGGYHYPSDVLAGAAIGFASVAVVRRSGLAAKLSSRVDTMRLANPGIVALLGFLLAFQLATLFDDLRTGAHDAHRRLKQSSEPQLVAERTVP